LVGSAKTKTGARDCSDGNFRTAKDLPRAVQTGKEALAKYSTDSAIKSSYALLLGKRENRRSARAAEAQLKGRTRIAKCF